MTNEEAIKELKKYDDEYSFNGDFVGAIRLAIQALKKQIPMKVEEKQVVEDGVFYNLDFLCPSCGNAVVGQRYEPDYCKHCGQALKWMAEYLYRCKHCIDIAHNEIAEEVAYCDITGEWMNVTLGECVGNCEQQVESEE